MKKLILIFIGLLLLFGCGEKNNKDSQKNLIEEINVYCNRTVCYTIIKDTETNCQYFIVDNKAIIQRMNIDKKQICE